MSMKGKSGFWGIAFAILFVGAAHTQNLDYAEHGIIPGSHRGAVTALLRDAVGRILSAGEDGFLGIWNQGAAEGRFQVSRYAIKFMAIRPGRPEVAVVESDGYTINNVSAWNYETKKKLFSLRFLDSVSGINYSAAGSFLIVSRSGAGATVLLDPETGGALKSPELPRSITLASTGLSERNMVFYQPSGILSYWNLEQGNETQRLNVPSNIQNPVLFGNNRILAGFDSGGLLVLDAVTGSVLAREAAIRQGSIFTENTDSTRFCCVSGNASSCTIYQMDISLSGILTINNRRVMFINEVNRGISVGGDNFILSTSLGDLWLVSGTETRVLETQNQEGILDIAVSSSNIALVSEKGTMVYLPLDYSRFEDGYSLMTETIGSRVYTGISSSPLPGESRFLLWDRGRSTPMVISPSAQIMLDKSPIRSPIRTAAMLGGNILLLDTTGVVSILDRGSGETTFSWTAAGSVDAAFIDLETIIIGRNAAAGNTPFLIINYLTGETVPLAYPGVVGTRVQRGGSGVIYGAVISQTAGNVSTSIVALDLSNPARSETIAEYDGEDPFIVMAESGGNLATTLGNGMAALYLNNQASPTQAKKGAILFEGAGFPIKIIDGGRYFVVLDGEGTISWHDNQTGKSLAVFRLYPDFWVLEKTTLPAAGREILRGGVIKRP